MPALRLACLAVPLFPLAARLRSQPELAGEALAIFAGNGNAARVAAATRTARRAGIKPGMTLPQARALLPRLLAAGRDGECERAAQEALLEVAQGFSPRVEDGGEGCVYLDLSGLDRHFEGEGDLGGALARAGKAAGLPARVGIAASKLAARVAAELPGSPTVVPAGEEAAFLAPLPLTRLAPEVEVAAALRRWGIRSVGDFARLPANEVASRLGPVGNELHLKARGEDSRPLVPWQPPPAFREGLDLEWPLVSLEPFLFLARAALDRLCARLAARGLACKRLEVSLRLEPDGHRERAIELPAPSREAKTLLTLVRLDLEAAPPGAPVAGFIFAAHPDRPREVQLSLLGPSALSPDLLATTLARLFALLGPGRAGSPRSVDAHRPGAVALAPYAPPKPPAVAPPPASGRGLLAVRVLRQPVPIEVVLEDAAAGPPQAGARPLPDTAGAPLEIAPVVNGKVAAARPQIRGRVAVASGPWRLEEGWWTEQPVDREYWDVELAGGGAYRIYHERSSGEWFADGVYD